MRAVLDMRDLQCGMLKQPVWFSGSVPASQSADPGSNPEKIVAGFEDFLFQAFGDIDNRHPTPYNISRRRTGGGEEEPVTAIAAKSLLHF